MFESAMELRSRSRSKTPFRQQHIFEGTLEGDNHVSVTRTTRRTTTVRSSDEVSGYSEQYTNLNKAVQSKSGKSEKTTRNAAYKTSDYSSEDGEVEVRHISQNQKNQLIEDAKLAANGNNEISALDLYRKAGRYWDKYPKTDWTYSPHSRDRVELAPGVVAMPNMSRRPIHYYDSSTNTDSSYFHTNTWRSSYNNAKQRLFSRSSNNSSDSTYKIIRKSSTTTITSIFTNIYTTIFSWFYYLYAAHNFSVVWIGKKLHHFASRMMLWDTWFLRTSRSGSKTRRVVALCLLPLLLFAGWWLLSAMGTAASVYFTPSVVSPLITNSKPPQIEENLTYDSKIEPQTLVADEKLHSIINELRQDISTVNNKLLAIEKSRNEDLDRVLLQVRSENVENIARLTAELKRCCQQPLINIESHITKVFENLLNNPDFLSNQEGLSKWLHALFVAKHDLEFRLSNLTENLPKSFPIEATAERVMDEIVVRMEKRIGSESISDFQIKEIVKATLAVYDADKTGLVDYAMEPLGGQVFTTRCTENYHSGSAVVSIWGIPLWHPVISPRTVITPGINPGECWSFQNFPGFLVIKLANRVRIEAFSMEHISRLLVPGGKIDSAPKEFEVFGLKGENDKEPVRIGKYVYDYGGDSIQFFAAQQNGLVFDMVEIRILSNHGNPNYTCLYRFRVHGSLVSEDI